MFEIKQARELESMWSIIPPLEGKGIGMARYMVGEMVHVRALGPGVPAGLPSLLAPETAFGVAPTEDWRAILPSLAGLPARELLGLP
jgi:hypothetical protein